MIITRTPLRISFVGGGTDLPIYYENHFSGQVISVTPQLYVDVILRKRNTREIGLNDGHYHSIDSISNPYIREALRHTNVTEGIYLITVSDTPAGGSGLGSSSATLVGALNALYRYMGIVKRPIELAKIACEIEIEILGLSSGKQDAYASAYGGLNHFTFYNNGLVDVNDTDSRYGIECEKGLTWLKERLMLFYTGKTRKSETILKEISDKKKIDVLREIHKLVKPFVKAVASESDDVGMILDNNWHLKKELASGITDLYLDRYYEIAQSAGAIGGKLLGAGGGGFFLFYVPIEKQESVRSALQDLQEFPVEFTDKGTEIIYAKI